MAAIRRQPNGCGRVVLVMVLWRQPFSKRGHNVVGAVLTGVEAGMERIGSGGMQGIESHVGTLAQILQEPCFALARHTLLQSGFDQTSDWDSTDTTQFRSRTKPCAGLPGSLRVRTGLMELLVNVRFGSKADIRARRGLAPSAQPVLF